MVIYIYTGWWFQPLWKIWKSVGMIIPNIWKNKKCTKPPISIYVYNYLHEIKWRGKDHLRQSHIKIIRVPPTVNTYIIYIWVWVNTYRYMFSGMNIHLPAILGFTRYQGFDPSPYIQLYRYIWANYNNSLIWIKAIWGWFPLLTMNPVRS